jgi:hypothetical protein
MEGRAFYKNDDLPANNHDLLFSIGNGAFDDGIPLAKFDICLCATDIHGIIALEDVEFLQRIQSRRIFNIAGTDIKAS